MEGMELGLAVKAEKKKQNSYMVALTKRQKTKEK